MAQNPQRAPLERLSPTIRQFWRLLEFTRDIDRNEDDSSFAQGGGTILYVFDENVFEFFIKPQAFSRYAELFHTNLWFGRDSVSDDLRRISAQSALVASEYLFSGDLPGQKNRAIHMAEYHFGELRHRRTEYTAELRNEIETLSKTTGSASQLKDDPALDYSHVDNLTQKDLDNLDERTDDVIALDRFRLARVAARQLTRSERLGPMHQIKRIGSKEIAGRIVPLGARYRPSPEESGPIRKDRRDLLRLLREEQRRREEAQERRAETRQPEYAVSRHDRGLENDADALAYIQWIARHELTGRERILLVTGDSLLFDVYRAWHLDQPAGEPFILRRVSQFAPIINLNDARSDIVGRRELFLATREAVEAALFVFNLSGPGKSPDHLHQGREHLALALSRYRDPERDPALAAFLTGLTKEWIDQRRGAFTRVVHLWQQLERFVIGVHYDLIMQRFTSDEQHQVKEVVAAGGQEAYVSYLKNLLGELVSGSIRLFFPFAADFIRSAASREYFDATRQSRVPIALRLSIPAPPADAGSNLPRVTQSKFDDIRTLFARCREGDAAAIELLDVRSNPTLAQRPDLVYAIAATLALEASEWREAERFADLARSADPMLPIAAEELEESRFESTYLFAIAKRFRIGSMDPSSSGNRTNIWRDLLNAAVNSLMECELHHARKGEIRRQIRAISERAAARLFFVSWAAVTPLNSLAMRRFEFGDAIEQFNFALDDLRRCLELESTGRNIDPPDERRMQFFLRLERQYTTNLAAAQVIKLVLEASSLKPQLDGLTAAEVELVSSRIAQWDADNLAAKLPLAAQTDLLAFKGLVQRDPRAISQFTRWLEQKHRLDLPLDRAVAGGLAKLFSAAPAH